MMINRREFLINNARLTGFILSYGILLKGCTVVSPRQDMALHGSNSQVLNLDESRRTILQHGSLAPSGHNSQPWRVRIESPDSWIIESDAARTLPAVDPHNREMLLSLGAFAENLSLAAGAVGFETDFQVIANSPHARNVVRVRLHQDTPVHYPLWRLEKRRTVKHGQHARELSVKDVNALTRHAGGHISYFPRGSRHAALIRDMAVENFRLQAWRDDAQRELIQWLRLSHADALRYRDGLTTEGMEINALKGWLLRSFVSPKDFMKPRFRQQGIDMLQQLAGQGGGWLVIASPGNTVADLLATGRRFERLALKARELGIGVHPMTQILEEDYGRNQIAANHSSDFFPQFILRVGYLDAYPEPVSLRRPVEWFAYRG